MNMNTFRKDRDEALLSLDEDKIRTYCQTYGAPMSSDPTVFWASVHKARLQILSIPEEAKEVSRRWLRTHGFSLRMF